MTDWLVENLNARERLMYRIAITNAKDPELVDNSFYHAFGRDQPERSKREDPERGCGALNTSES